MDFRDKDYTGKDVAQAMAKCGIIGNFNMVPGDHRSPFVTSGVRLGTPSLTSMGMKEPEMDMVAGWIDTVCQNIQNVDTVAATVKGEIAELCSKFKIPGVRE